jgi:hypothetical protein
VVPTSLAVEVFAGANGGVVLTVGDVFVIEALGSAFIDETARDDDDAQVPFSGLCSRANAKNAHRRVVKAALVIVVVECILMIPFSGYGSDRARTKPIRESAIRRTARNVPLRDYAPNLPVSGECFDSDTSRHAGPSESFRE